MTICYILSQNSAPRQQQQPMQQHQPNPQQQFPQQQQLIQNNVANASSDQLQGIVLQETDRYAGLSGFDSIPPPATSVSAAQKQNQLTNPTTGIIGNANFDTNFNSINTNNFSNNSGIFCTDANSIFNINQINTTKKYFCVVSNTFFVFHIDRVNLSL